MTTRRRMLSVLAFGLAGCAKPDWIESTLVTVDVTGQWTGGVAGLRAEMTLRQRGSFVTGEMAIQGYNQGAARGVGPVEGEISGDMLRLRQTNGRWKFELTVGGDEMTGSGSTSGGGWNPGPFAMKLRRSQ